MSNIVRRIWAAEGLSKQFPRSLKCEIKSLGFELREALHKYGAFPRGPKPDCNGTYGATEVSPFQDVNLCRPFLESCSILS